jgi:hypothetical protein
MTVLWCWLFCNAPNIPGWDIFPSFAHVCSRKKQTVTTVLTTDAGHATDDAGTDRHESGNK